jgi:hypothetical protein
MATIAIARVQSKFAISITSIPARERIASHSLSAQRLSPFFLVGLLLGVRSLNRAAAMTHKLLSFFDDSFGGLAQLLSLLIQVVESLSAALAKRFPRLLARNQRGHQPTNGP